MHCLYFGGYLETILTAAILMVPSVNFEALLPLVGATPVRVHSLSRIMLRCPCYQPQWLAVDRRSHAIELVQSAFGNTAVSVRVRGRCSWASGQERFAGPMWVQEPIGIQKPWAVA
jgi:hypothetical protein